jgi:FKBP-type peptidyl-prolyl cis-trans isomerase SlyD
MSDRIVEDGAIVGITYLLTDVETGKVLDQNAGGEPFAFLSGKGQILKGLAAGLEGMAEGSEFDLTLEPADGYGERKGPGPQAVKRREFRRDVHMTEGMRFKHNNSKGVEVVLWVTKIAGSRIYVDTEHPLTGKTRRFTGKVALVRDATEEEIAHGHAHGVHGHANH